MPRLVLQRPLVFRHERVHDLLHRKVRNQLVHGQFDARHRVKVADALQVLLNVLALVRDARGRYHRVLQDLETDFAAQVVRNFAFLQTKNNNKNNNKSLFNVIAPIPLLHSTPSTHPPPVVHFGK